MSAEELGRQAVEKGFVTESQLREALAETGAGRSVGEILVGKGHMTAVQLGMLEAAPARERLGKYELVRKLGSGGMGVVYEAIDGVLHRTVALKTLAVLPGARPSEVAEDEQRFLRESRLAAGLPKHPHIVGVHEAGILEGRRYLVMEYIPGRHLGEWRMSVLDDLRAQIALLRDVARAVHHAHEHGILHRDLKPQNILVDDQGLPHVTDFGLAKPLSKEAADSLTTTGMVVGTPSYMSPEQAKGLKTPDRRSDVYALGVLLFEMLTGRTPFEADTAIEMLVKVIEHPVPAPSAVCAERRRPAPAPSLEAACLRALAKAPESRFATAAEFADALDRWLAAPPPRPASRGWLAGALAAVLLGAAALWAFRPPAGPARPAALEGHGGSVTAVAYSPDGTLLATGGGDRLLRLWDARTGAALRSFGPHAAKVEGAVFSPDGRWIAAVTEPDEGAGEVKLWPAAGGEPRELRGHGDGVNALAVARDGSALATGDQGGQVKLWDPASGRERASWKAHAQAVRGAAFSPDGRRLVTGGWDHRVVVWELPAGREAASFDGFADGVWAVAYSPDGLLVAGAGSDRKLRVWEVETRRLRATFEGHGDVVVALAFSPDGRSLASGSWDRTARVWRLEGGAPPRVLSGHGDSVWSLAFSPDGRTLATGSLDRTVRFWELPPP